MSESRRVTLADIARRAGVHVTTVSLALRDHPRIPETTKERIKELAREMGYTPDPLLSALASYRTGKQTPRYQSTIAYLTNWASEWGWKNATGHLEFHQGAERMAGELGFKLEHFSLRTPDMTAARLNKVFQARGIVGLILASHGREQGDMLDLDWSNFCCVKIDYFPHHPLVHNVTNYQFNIVRLAIHRLRERGYRRIGLVMHRGWDHSVDYHWSAGYLCEQQGIPKTDGTPPLIYPKPSLVERWLREFDDAEALCPDPAEFERWLRRYRPEVILSNTKFLAPVLKKLKLRVPQDFSFVDLFLEDFSGATAGVRQNHARVGELAVELVSGQISHNKRGIPEFPTTTFVEGTWIDGASCPPRN